MPGGASAASQEEWLNTVDSPAKAPGQPVWRQVRDDLAARILDGRLHPGQELPKEAELAEAYAIAHSTLRHALNDLNRSGLVHTKAGVASFIATPMIRLRVEEDEAGLVETMEAHGHSVRHVVLGVRDLRPPRRRVRKPTVQWPAREPSERLVFPDYPGAVREFRYVRFIDDVPWSLSVTTIPTTVAPERWDGRESRLIAELKATHGIELRQGERRFSAAIAEDADASELTIRLGAPILVLHTMSVDQHGHLVAQSLHRVSGERGEYAVHSDR